MRKLILLAICFSNFCIAGNSGDVIVSSVMSNNTLGDKVYVKTTPKVNDCSPIGDYQYRLDTSTEIGKLMASQLLTAYATSKTVVLVGTGVCTGGNTEILKEVMLK